jgi:glucose/arabinose dehydrogenase/mono/diheme cytochrome c family protein
MIYRQERQERQGRQGRQEKEMKEVFVLPFLAILAFLACLAVGFSPAAVTQPSTAPATQPVPLLSPEEEAKTFNLPPGFRAEVVAAEPMVEHPVAIAFDPDGRLFVAEMRGYMPDTEGWGESKPTGRISILQDTDGDGRMDRSTVFLDKLVLPRAVGFARDGVLVGTPPKLLFCRDLDGDGRADSVETIASDFGIVENPENSANGLLFNLDNWIYCANYEKRIRPNRDGGFEFDRVPDMGQYGIARDDWGRMFFNTNSDYLRGALIPPHYSSRNPKSPIALTNTQIAKDQTVWPAHAATVNRGYRPGFLRADGTLVAFTAACSPCIYRANLFPKDFYGNAFVCEATSNLVRRAVIHENDGVLTAKNAYAGREFLASTYERFRPVNLAVGPEGALYVVDMHHGLIQHRISITDYAKSEYKKKRLDKHLLTGRIFRIVPTAGAPSARPQLNRATTPQLVAQLTHPNGWWRDAAQRLLVERKDPAAASTLREMALRDRDPLERAIALWTLDGIGQLDDVTLVAALKDAEPKVRANAIRLCEARGSCAEEAIKLADDDDPQVRLQFVLSMSRGHVELVLPILREHGDQANLRDAAISGMAGHELTVLRHLVADTEWSQRTVGRADVLTDIARSLMRRDDPKEVLSLASLIGGLSSQQRWQQSALLEAIPEARQDVFGAIKAIAVDEKPAAIERLASSDDPRVRKGAAKVAALFDWPGKPTPPRPKVEPLTPRQQGLFEIGRQQFTLVCAQCHRPDGMGQEGKAPPLINSPWALGPDRRLIRIVLHGLHGPVQVAGGRVFNQDLKLDMPSLKALNDDQIAGVLTYIRRSWGHEAPAVDPAAVANIRDWTQARRDGWTEPELLQVK